MWETGTSTESFLAFSERRSTRAPELHALGNG